MKLFHAHGSCSLGIRILLEEIGAPYELLEVRLAEGDQRSPAYLAQNPKGKVPALVREDERVVTEYPVISLFLAQSFPEAALLPSDEDQKWQALELVEYVVSSLHMRGATLAMRADKFAQDQHAREAIAEHGRSVLIEGFAQLEARLAGRAFFFDRFTIADAAVFYLLAWHPRFGIELPEKLQIYFGDLSRRPSVQRALHRGAQRQALP